MTETKRFSSRKKPIPFYVDDDLFYAAATIPAGVLIDMGNIKQQLAHAVKDESKGKEQLNTLLEVFKIVFISDSYDLLVKRLYDVENPIDLAVLLDVMQWLFGEKYGGRPTQPLPSSSTTSPSGSDGMNSTGGVSLKELTQLKFPGIDSSTSSTTT